MKRIALSIIAYILTIFSVLGQSNMIPTMTVNEKQSDVVLSKLDIDVVVSGNLATTTFDMFFTNNSSSILEGNFEFPLGEGQSISRYALDINGILREGVVVEKEKARKTFEEIERRNVDPGILEQTAGNNFRTRVYPLDPGKSRHVVIAYEQELSVADGKVFYKLPLQSEKVIDEVSMNVTITGGKVEPIFKRVFQKNAYFAKNDKSYTYNFSKKKYQFAEGIEIELPLKCKDGAQIYVESDSKGSYFSIFDLIEQEASNPKAAVKKLTVIYDVSSSTSNSDKALNKEIILNYLKDQKISYFRLVTFSNAIHLDKVFSKKEFIQEFDKIEFDGATNFGCIDFNKYDCDEILLFSDGLGNIGGEEPVYGKTPVDIINSSNISNHSFLKSIAQKSHGKYINTQAVEKNKINILLSNNSLEVINIEYDSERVSEIYPRSPHQVTNSISIAGKLNKKDATIKVTLGYRGEPMETRTYNVSAASSNTLKNVKRIWAQKKLNDLDVNYEKNKKEISRLSKDFSIVTRNTSFIVLESVDDYIRYDITPPAELMDEYHRILGNRDKSLDVDTANAPKIPEKVFKAMTDFRNKYKECQKITIQGVVTDGEQPIPDVETDNSQFFDGLVVSDNRHQQESDLTGSETSSDDESERQHSNSSGISQEIKFWSPDNEYMETLRETESKEMYGKYLQLKDEYQKSPSFYLDVASYFAEEGMIDNAVRIVSNISEMNLEEAETARSCAKKLMEFKEYSLAASVFERVIGMRGEEPHSYRDLAQAYIELERYQEAADLLYKAGTGKWDSRFKNSQQISLNELGALIAMHTDKIDTTKYDKRLVENFPLDLRIILTWNTNDCDIDLWVIDPNQEKCYYSHKRTKICGWISDDITGGYGPEEFCLIDAIDGDYKIYANYYGSRSPKKLQPVVVQATIYTNFGRPEQKMQIMTLQLENAQHTYEVGTITFRK